MDRNKKLVNVRFPFNVILILILGVFTYYYLFIITGVFLPLSPIRSTIVVIIILLVWYFSLFFITRQVTGKEGDNSVKFSNIFQTKTIHSTDIIEWGIYTFPTPMYQGGTVRMIYFKLESGKTYKKNATFLGTKSEILSFFGKYLGITGKDCGCKKAGFLDLDPYRC